MEKASWWEKLITALLLTFVVGLFARAGYSNQAPQQVNQPSGSELSHPFSTTQLP